MKIRYIFHFGSIVLLLSTVVLAGCSTGEDSLAYIMAVVCGCLSCHLIIWIMSAILVVGIMNNNADDSCIWFKEFSWEKNWYRLIRIRKWKHLLPTYAPSFYDFNSVLRNELLGRISQTEVVHEVAALFSLLSIIGAFRYGYLTVFVIVAIIDCIINIVYASLQRYNRMRLRRIL